MTYTEVDYFSAAQIYFKAAEKGDASAQFNLALIMIDGLGIEKDYEAAVFWLEKASELGHPKADDALQQLYTLMNNT